MKLFKRRAKTESGSQPKDQEVVVDEQPSEAAAVPVAQQDGLAASVSSVVADDRTAKSAEPGMFERLRAGLGRSRSQLSEGLASLVLGKKQLDPALMEEIEEQLIMADLGLETSARVLELLRQRLDRKSLSATETVMSALKATLVELLMDQEQPLKTEGHRPFVILVVGVNGAGKTTTINMLTGLFPPDLSSGDTQIYGAGIKGGSAMAEARRHLAEPRRAAVSLYDDAVDVAKLRKVLAYLAWQARSGVGPNARVPSAER